MSKILIVGGGAAGMFASVVAAKRGKEVHLFEKNERLGKKLYITGKGRCNVTNACEVEDLFKNMVSNAKFMFSAFYSFTNHDMMAYLENLGLRLKTERGQRVFPASDKSSDIIGALTSDMKSLGVHIHLKSEVDRLEISDNVFKGLYLKDGRKVLGDSVIVCTGGISYPSTGSTGDGYRFARYAGLDVTETKPSLVPMIIKESICKELQGLSLKNTGLTITSGKKKVYEDQGEMLFTHFGVSGPMILSGSAYCIPYLDNKNLEMHLDFKPALTAEKLDLRLLRDFEAKKNKQFCNSLGELFPSKLIPIMVRLSGIDPYKKVQSVSREERQYLCRLIKDFKLHIVGLRGFNEAIITHGGVSIKNMNPSTMESRQVRGLFFAGEVLDLDALTGGFNLQIAWSTAYLAGINA